MLDHSPTERERPTPDTHPHEHAPESSGVLRTQVRTSLRLAGILTVAGSALLAAYAHRTDPAPDPVVHRAPQVARRDPTPTPRPPEPTPVPAIDREEAEREISALAGTLQRLRVHNPELLASAVHAAVSGTPDEELLPFLLAIARTETDGRVLAVSPAGAVGLAQATPIAAIGEGVTDPLYVTQDYIDGAFAYTMKKPLADVERIASDLRAGGDREEALALLQRACALRRTGVDALLLLEPYEQRRDGVPMLAERVAAQDRVNVEVIDALTTMLARDASPRELDAFRGNVRRAYHTLRAEQRKRWKRYEDDLTRRRDAALRRTYPGRSIRETLDHHASDAGALLGSTLDARFDPDRMAIFLRAHVQRIRTDLVALDLDERGVAHEKTAMLYNAGPLNVLRAEAGLAPLPLETRRYVARVTRTHDQLEAALEQSRSGTSTPTQ